MPLALPDLIFVVLVYVLILVIGIWAAKKITTRGAEELLVAGRNLGPVVGTITLTTCMTAGRYVSEITETVYQGGSPENKYGGLVWCHIPLATCASLVIGGIFFAKKMRANNYVTMLDPCMDKFGSITGAVLFIPVMISELSRLGLSISYLGNVLLRRDPTDSGHTSVFLVCSGTVAIAVWYSAMGGLRSVVRTDIAKFGLLFCGLWIFAPCALANHKYVRCIMGTKYQWLGYLESANTGTFVDKYLALIFGGIVWQTYFQRVLALRTPKHAQLSSFIAAFGCMVIAMPSILLGAVARSTDWNRTDPAYVPVESDSPFIFSLVLQALTPAVIAAIGLGVVAITSLTAFDSSLLATSSMFTTNVFLSVVKTNATEAETVRCFRITVLLFGFVGATLGCAVLPYTAIQILITELLYIIIFPQLLCALYVNRCNGYGSLTALLSGFILRMLSGDPRIGLPTIIQYPFYNSATQDQLFPFRTCLMLLTTLLLVSVSMLARYLFVTARVVPGRFDFLRTFNRSPDILSALADASSGTSDLRLRILHKSAADSGGN